MASCMRLTDRTAPERSLYRRVLPSSQIAFHSPEGKRRFRSALSAGYAEPFFPLVCQFQTQDEPAYCGLTTLAMVLNALEIDPRRVWKGPWRWFSENLLECCVDLEYVKRNGITMEEFVCLGVCNGAKVSIWRGLEVDRVRKILDSTMRGPVEGGSWVFLVASYSRQYLGQTGEGHFSPIAAYDRETDSCLVLDVARFKYPPYWVKLKDLVESAKLLVSGTDMSRGFLLINKAPRSPVAFMKVKMKVGFSPRKAMEGVVSTLDSYGDSEKNIASVVTLVMDLLRAFKEYGGAHPLDLVECDPDYTESHSETDRQKAMRAIVNEVHWLPVYEELAEDEAILGWIPRKFSREDGLLYIVLFCLTMVAAAGYGSPANDVSCPCVAKIPYGKIFRILTGREWNSLPPFLAIELEILRTQLVSAASLL